MLIILFRRKTQRITQKLFFFNLNLNQIKALITKEKKLLF